MRQIVEEVYALVNCRRALQGMELFDFSAPLTKKIHQLRVQGLPLELKAVDPSLPEISRRLAKARSVTQLSLRDAAVAIGVHFTTLARVESGVSWRGRNGSANKAKAVDLIERWIREIEKRV